MELKNKKKNVIIFKIFFLKPLFKKMIDFLNKHIVGYFLFFSVFLFFLNSSAEAHRISPAITSLFSQPDSLRAEISINREARIAGIGPEHEDTDDAPASGEYNRLRAMPAPKLEQVFQGFSSEFMKQLEIRLDEQPLEAKLKELIIRRNICTKFNLIKSINNMKKFRRFFSRKNFLHKKICFYVLNYCDYRFIAFRHTSLLDVTKGNNDIS